MLPTVKKLDNGAQDATEISGWPIAPQRLGRVQVLNLLSNVALASITIPFLVLISIVIDRNGRPVDRTDWHRIERGIGAAASLFPIVFAAIIGKMTREFAAWRLEHGVSIRTLEQLCGSSTFLSTLSTQFSLRAVNLLALFLVILWSISPLGSQSILRMVHIQPTTATRAVGVSYANDTRIATDWDYIRRTSSIGPTMYDSSLLSPNVVKQSPLDIWGGVKVPLVGLGGSTPKTSDWIDLTTSNVNYSSLAGIRLGGITDEIGETTFTMEASYFNLHLDHIEGTPTFNGRGFRYNATNGCQDTDPAGEIDGQHFTTGILFTITVPGTNFTAAFNATEQFVDMRIRCVDGMSNCATTAVRYLSRRNSEARGPYSINCKTITILSRGLESKSKAGALTEAFLRNPDTPLAAGTYSGSAFTLSVDVFHLRLTQVFNTYALLWRASSTQKQRFQNGTGTFKDSTLAPTYVVDWAWLTVSFVATVIMLIGGFVPVVLGFLTLNPDILGYVSTMTRDSSTFDVPPGGCTLSGLELSSLLKDRTLRLGNVEPDSAPIGRLGIATSDKASPSSREQWYE
ncbi:hypothetical protein BDV26DRAFT_283426 [Aspergillus bertholletiae]|uniref:Uncharacterized protein n=1 Tax=Aspergillus bertholletiae TaxID=1226010 RepID=A0A5N7B082_9EURO|nr:hypothetical protein BDV26DRAFT_283426 [Aspergillus bertholletiae]